MSAKPLRGGRALITGASAGIGEAFARTFAANGFDLVLVARRGDRLKKLADELVAEYALDVQVQALDLLAPNALEQLHAACSELEIDVLVNNAGVMYHGDFSTQDRGSIDSIIQLNVYSLTQLSRLFLEPMLARGKGRILNISSTTGFQSGPTVAVYAASKGYILTFTEALAEELRGSGVYATAFCPGSTDTDMMVESFGEDLRSDPLSAMLTMSTADVAEQGFRACMAGETIAVPGIANNIITTISRLQPRWLNRRMQAFFYRKFIDASEPG